MTERKAWFFVMTPEIAARPGSQWARTGVASPDTYAFRPIAPEGWVALIGFAALAVAVLLGIWIGLVMPGHVPAAMGIVFTVMVESIVIGSFVLLVQWRMPPRGDFKPVEIDQTFQILW